MGRFKEWKTAEEGTVSEVQVPSVAIDPIKVSGNVQKLRTHFHEVEILNVSLGRPVHGREFREILGRCTDVFCFVIGIVQLGRVMSEPETETKRDLGPQPLNDLMSKWGLSNHDLVEISPEQMTHKQVQKSRLGRRLTLKMMMKMARTLNLAIWGRLQDEEREDFEEYMHKHLFNYAKGFDPGAEDINHPLVSNLSDRRVRKDFRRELMGGNDQT